MIWTYKENEGAEISDAALQAFKPTGNFFDDVKAASDQLGKRVLLVTPLGIHLHPGLR